MQLQLDLTTATDTATPPAAPPASVHPAAARAARVRADRIEDLEWMARTGEILDNAAARLGMSPKSVEKFLEREKRGDLLRLLRVVNTREAAA